MSYRCDLLIIYNAKENVNIENQMMKKQSGGKKKNKQGDRERSRSRSRSEEANFKTIKET